MSHRSRKHSAALLRDGGLPGVVLLAYARTTRPVPARPRRLSVLEEDPVLHLGPATSNERKRHRAVQPPVDLLPRVAAEGTRFGALIEAVRPLELEALSPRIHRDHTGTVRRHPLGSLFAGLLMTTVLAACGGSGSHAATAADRAQLDAAIDRMHALQSFREIATGSDTGDRIVTDFQAPDRTHTVQDGPSGHSESFRGDGKIYHADETRPGYFTTSSLPPPTGLSTPFLLVDVFRHVPFERRGSLYTADLPSNKSAGSAPGSADLTVEGGFITKTVFRHLADGKTVAETTTYSLFDAAPPVVLPPPDRVTPVPTTPTCDTAGLPPPGQVVCTGGGRSDIGSPVSVPHPASPARSTLQFRPVLDMTAASCSTPGENPSAEADANLPDAKGSRCFRLGPAGLTVTKAKADAVHGIGGTVNVELQFSSADARLFDDLGSANYQRQVAVVMFGEVLSAPQINATQFNGRAEISGLTPEQAGKVIAALSG